MFDNILHRNESWPSLRAATRGALMIATAAMPLVTVAAFAARDAVDLLIADGEQRQICISIRAKEPARDADRTDAETCFMLE